MSKDNTQNKMNEGDEMLDDYTGLLKNGVRGKYAGKITKIQVRPVTPQPPVERVVVLSPEVAAAYPTDEAINNALRSLMASRAEETAPAQ